MLYGTTDPAYEISDYNSEQWWCIELEKIYTSPIDSVITADMKRAARVAKNLMFAVEKLRKEKLRKDPCVIDPVLSRVCSHGTKSCSKDHD